MGAPGSLFDIKILLTLKFDVICYYFVILFSVARMSDNGGPVTIAEGDNYQVAVECQDVIPRIRYYFNIPQGSVVRHADVHR